MSYSYVILNNIVKVSRFGDQKYCNKIAQLETPKLTDSDAVVFLDTDMIVLRPINDIFTPGFISGKIVDNPNPSIDLLDHIYQLASFTDRPQIIKTDCTDSTTFSNNLNGGLYVIPSLLLEQFCAKWKFWALWLLDNVNVLARENKAAHVDQVSFSLASHELKIPIKHLLREYNFPAHIDIVKSGRPAVIHFHDKISKTGLLDINGTIETSFSETIDKANQFIGSNFNNRIFWSYRYYKHPELGSGVGSRGSNLEYKKKLLTELDIETAPSILDIGCGDLELVKEFNFKKYTGVDLSPLAVESAKKIKPNYEFLLYNSKCMENIPRADTVLCFEVLIHQSTKEDYENLIKILTEKPTRRLIVSGFLEPPVGYKKNHMIYFYESLLDSIVKTNKFKTVRVIGQHTSVQVIVAEI